MSAEANIKRAHSPYYLERVDDYLEFLVDIRCEHSPVALRRYLARFARNHEQWQVDQAGRVIRLHGHFTGQVSGKSVGSGAVTGTQKTSHGKAAGRTGRTVEVPPVSRDINDPAAPRTAEDDSCVAIDPAIDPGFREPVQREEMIRETKRIMRVRRVRLSTEKTYLQRVRRYFDFLHMRGEMVVTETSIRLFLSELAVRHRVSSATQRQAFNALLFFIRHTLRHSFATHLVEAGYDIRTVQKLGHSHDSIDTINPIDDDRYVRPHFAGDRQPQFAGIGHRRSGFDARAVLTEW